MASCGVCGNRIGFLEGKRHLIDGICCWSCWKKSGIKEELCPLYYVSEFKHLVQRSESIELATQKLKSFYKMKLKEKGFIEGEHGYGTLLGGKDYRYWIIDNILYQVNTGIDYREQYDISNKVNTFEDVENLEPLELDCKMIPVEKIQYFAKEGDIQYTTKVTGGGGGGSSVSGAVVGGIFAGEVGAIIGSRKKIDPITSVTEEHDTTKTILKYFDETGLNTVVSRGFKLYDILLKNIPEKDLLSVQIQSTQTEQSTFSLNSDGIKDKLKTIKNLFEEGLITEKEYNEKRQELLNQF